MSSQITKYCKFENLKVSKSVDSLFFENPLHAELQLILKVHVDVVVARVLQAEEDQLSALSSL